MGSGRKVRLDVDDDSRSPRPSVSPRPHSNVLAAVAAFGGSAASATGPGPSVYGAAGDRRDGRSHSPRPSDDEAEEDDVDDVDDAEGSRPGMRQQLPMRHTPSGSSRVYPEGVSLSVELEDGQPSLPREKKQKKDKKEKKEKKERDAREALRTSSCGSRMLVDLEQMEGSGGPSGASTVGRRDVPVAAEPARLPEPRPRVQSGEERGLAPWRANGLGSNPEAYMVSDEDGDIEVAEDEDEDDNGSADAGTGSGRSRGATESSGKRRATLESTKHFAAKRLQAAAHRGVILAHAAEGIAAERAPQATQAVKRFARGSEYFLGAQPDIGDLSFIAFSVFLSLLFLFAFLIDFMLLMIIIRNGREELEYGIMIEIAMFFWLSFQVIIFVDVGVSYLVFWFPKTTICCRKVCPCSKRFRRTSDEEENRPEQDDPARSAGRATLRPPAPSCSDGGTGEAGQAFVQSDNSSMRKSSSLPATPRAQEPSAMGRSVSLTAASRAARAAREFWQTGANRADNDEEEGEEEEEEFEPPPSVCIGNSQFAQPFFWRLLAYYLEVKLEPRGYLLVLAVLLPLNTLFFYSCLGQPDFTPTIVPMSAALELIGPSWPTGGGLSIDNETFLLTQLAPIDNVTFEPFKINLTQCYEPDSSEYLILARLLDEEMPKQAYCESNFGSLMAQWGVEAHLSPGLQDDDLWEEMFDFTVRLFGALAGMVADRTLGREGGGFMEDLTDLFDMYMFTFVDVIQMHEGRPLLAFLHKFLNIDALAFSYQTWVALVLALAYIALVIRALSVLGWTPIGRALTKCGIDLELTEVNEVVNTFLSLLCIEIPFLILRFIAWFQYSVPVSVLAVKNIFQGYMELRHLGVIKGFGEQGDREPPGKRCWKSIRRRCPWRREQAAPPLLPDPTDAGVTRQPSLRVQRSQSVRLAETE